MQNFAVLGVTFWKEIFRHRKTSLKFSHVRVGEWKSLRFVLGILWMRRVEQTCLRASRKAHTYLSFSTQISARKNIPLWRRLSCGRCLIISTHSIWHTKPLIVLLARDRLLHMWRDYWGTWIERIVSCFGWHASKAGTLRFLKTISKKFSILNSLLPCHASVHKQKLFWFGEKQIKRNWNQFIAVELRSQDGNVSRHLPIINFSICQIS